ncbi:MAG: hypothetical protein LUH07_03105 [Lachnospiraceae bacterium]|nr:hypothetical protein [Lachnospiraceae bacterium]
MDSSLYTIIDIVVAACGIYVIVQYILMVRTHQLRQNMLLPKDLQIKRCKDVDGYIKAVGSKQLVFGISGTVCGVVSLLQDVYGYYNVFVSMGVMALFIILCVWYGRASGKAIKEFW